MTIPQTYAETALDEKTNQFGDIYIEHFVGDIFESRCAAVEFQTRFGNDIFQKDTLYVIVGSDSGLLPKFIINRGLPRGSRYLFIEPEAIKSHLNRSNLISEELSDRIAFSDLKSWSDQARKMALSKYAYSGKISYVRSCAAQLGSYPEYPHLTQAVSQELRHLFWLFTSQFDEHVFIKTQLTNLAENRIPSIRLKDVFKGKTAIVLAAGPSLDELLPWIEVHRNEAVIIAVSRISTRLLQAGLEPDIVCSVDPQFISFSVSKDMFKFSDKTLFVNSCNASPLLVGQWPHKQAFSGPRVSWYDEGFDNTKVIAPSVTNNAILLALELGCSQIILAGVDLCYSADGFTHTSGTKEHAAGPMIGNIDHTVETNGGSMAETNKGYYEAINTIAKQAMEATERKRRMINPAAGAARIENVEYIPTDQIIITQPLDKPAWKTISTHLDDDSPENRVAHYDAMLEKMDRAIDELKQIRRLAENALGCNEKMMKHVNSLEYSKHKRLMDKIERKLDNKFEAMGNAVKRYNAEGFAQIISADPGTDWSSDELFHKTKLYYEAFEIGTDALLDLIDSTKTRLKSRLEEEKPVPNLELTCIQWRQDLQLGRADIWKTKHPEVFRTLSPEAHEQLDMLSSEYKALLSADEENLIQHFHTLSRDTDTIGLIIENARANLESGNKNALQRIYDGLDKRDEPLAIQANLLIKGFIKELEQDYRSATHNYKLIDRNTSQELKQIALERILTFSMEQEDYPGALLTLHTLSEETPSYKPFYAQLLALTGAITESIEVYTQHLQQQPHDLNSMLALGLLLVEIGAKDAAQSAMEHIKDIDPNYPGIEQLETALKK